MRNCLVPLGLLWIAGIFPVHVRIPVKLN
uniref:Uncharacterized protein n=1 Tax=Arundo donax TaxID=35708 RepID=A0A0A9G843_ARUDO